MEDSRSSVTSETRKLAAIMFTDIVGFSRQMSADESRMLRLLEVHNQLVSQAVTTHHGHVIKTIGDAFLVDFPSVVHAMQCAQAIHAQLKAYNADKEQAEQIHVRIGIHLGDIVQRDGDVFGDGVNIASRLTTGYHLWSERYDRPWQHILRLQDEIVQKIVTTLKLQLTVQEQGYIVRKHTDNLEAYDYLLRGIEPFFRDTKEATAQARQLWEKAVALDPQYAEAYAWLSWTYYREWIFRWSAAPRPWSTRWR